MRTYEVETYIDLVGASAEYHKVEAQNTRQAIEKVLADAPSDILSIYVVREIDTPKETFLRELDSYGLTVGEFEKLIDLWQETVK